MESEEIQRFEKKLKRPITVADLLNKEFLYAMFTEYLDRIIVIKDSNNKEIDLFPKPFLGTLEGKLPLPLPESATPESEPYTFPSLKRCWIYTLKYYVI